MGNLDFVQICFCARLRSTRAAWGNIQVSNDLGDTELDHYVPGNKDRAMAPPFDSLCSEEMSE